VGVGAVFEVRGCRLTSAYDIQITHGTSHVFEGEVFFSFFNNDTLKKCRLRSHSNHVTCLSTNLSISLSLYLTSGYRSTSRFPLHRLHLNPHSLAISLSTHHLSANSSRPPPPNSPHTATRGHYLDPNKSLASAVLPVTNERPGLRGSEGSHLAAVPSASVVGRLYQ
jgi:hypothetical protein